MKLSFSNFITRFGVLNHALNQCSIKLERLNDKASSDLVSVFYAGLLLAAAGIKEVFKVSPLGTPSGDTKFAAHLFGHTLQSEEPYVQATRLIGDLKKLLAEAKEAGPEPAWSKREIVGRILIEELLAEFEKGEDGAFFDAEKFKLLFENAERKALSVEEIKEEG